MAVRFTSPLACAACESAGPNERAADKHRVSCPKNLRARRAAPKKVVPQPTELAGRLAEATDEAPIVDIIEEPVAGAVVVTEFESVRTSETEAPGPQHEGKDSSELGEHLH